MESHENDLRSAVGGQVEALDVQNDYRSANLSVREVALLDYAVKLTNKPHDVGKGDLDVLRGHGYTDEQIVDAVQCIGYFNFINRVLDGLGVDAELNMRYGKLGS